MYLSSITISGFRQFGTGEKALTIPFNKGITALVGRNDSGKTAVIDAIRLALLTVDHESFRIQLEDFHVNTDGSIGETICTQCTFSDLSDSDKGAFLEYLSYEDEKVLLHVHYTATRLADGPGRRRWLDIIVKCGKNGTGPNLESTVREMLAAAYLKPLRDAEREMSAGRNSRLSQILANLESVKQGNPFDANTLSDITCEVIDALGVVGLADFFAHHIKKHPGICDAKEKINKHYLKELSMINAGLQADIQFISSSLEDIRRKQVLERLELQGAACNGNLGLGSNNLLFIACELLLLGSETEGAPLLLIEEPEAHLHPQRQLRLMEFLKKTARGSEETGHPVQVILTTHSPNLASLLPLSSLVLLTDQTAFSLAPTNTRLSENDYSFLERFLDVTKANLFFAHGVIIVEGDAEAILLPTLAKLMGRDLTAHGVSIVNVGSTALSRFSKIFQRKHDDSPHISVPIACITDRDIMPDCAPKILGLVTGDNYDLVWENPKRKWRCEKEFTSLELDKKIGKKHQNDGQQVKTFVSDKWTFEYDLAFYGLKSEVHRAITLAKNDDQLQDSKKTYEDIVQKASESLPSEGTKPEVCTKIYSPLKDSVSKAITAQYLSSILEEKVKTEELSPELFAKLLPPYLVQAIKYVTGNSLGGEHD